MYKINLFLLWHIFNKRLWCVWPKYIYQQLGWKPLLGQSIWWCCSNTTAATNKQTNWLTKATFPFSLLRLPFQATRKSVLIHSIFIIFHPASACPEDIPGIFLRDNSPPLVEQVLELTTGAKQRAAEQLIYTLKIHSAHIVLLSSLHKLGLQELFRRENNFSKKVSVFCVQLW